MIGLSLGLLIGSVGGLTPTTLMKVYSGKINLLSNGDLILPCDSFGQCQWKKVAIPEASNSNPALISVYVKPGSNFSYVTFPPNSWVTAGTGGLLSLPGDFGEAAIGNGVVYILYKETLPSSVLYFISGDYRIVVVYST